MTQISGQSFDSVPYVLRVILARPRLWGCVVAGLIVAFSLPDSVARGLMQAVIGWNLGAGLYVLLALVMMWGAKPGRMRVNSVLQDDGKWFVLLFAAAAALFGMGIAVAELSVAKPLQGAQHMTHLALAGLTLVTSWGLVQIIFAQHYAHEHYLAQVGARPCGVETNGGRTPTYAAFLRQASSIGAMGYCSSLQLVSPALRQVGNLHRALALLFGLAWLVLLVNVFS
jgi:uncharacterized membrane protein